jgi:hypothetical protein
MAAGSGVLTVTEDEPLDLKGKKTMKFDDRVKALASMSILFCFTIYVSNVMVMSLGTNVRPFFVG